MYSEVLAQDKRYYGNMEKGDSQGALGTEGDIGSARGDPEVSNLSEWSSSPPPP